MPNYPGLPTPSYGIMYYRTPKEGLKITLKLNFEFASKVNANFNGGNLSSDAGLLLFKEFCTVIGLEEMLKDIVANHASNIKKDHKDFDIVMQLVFQKLSGYYTDDAADDLREDPIFAEIMGKPLASQPTISRFHNEFNKEDEGVQRFQEAQLQILETVYEIEKPKEIIFDFDSTFIKTNGKQQEANYNSYYGSKGFHPLVLFDGNTGDCIKAKLRPGEVYTSDGVKEFANPVFDRYKDLYPDLDVIIRADSGFACPALYKLCEEYEYDYVIRLKSNAVLERKAEPYISELHQKMEEDDDWYSYQVIYGEFTYQAGSWEKSRRVIVKVEKKEGEMVYSTSFYVTSLDWKPEKTVKFYNQRGTMENFIKEAKNGFGLDKLSSNNFLANEIKLQIAVLAYNVNNLTRRLCFPENCQSMQMISIRPNIIKIAAKKVTSSRYTTFKMSSHAVYKDLFLEIHRNISSLRKEKEPGAKAA